MRISSKSGTLSLRLLCVCQRWKECLVRFLLFVAVLLLGAPSSAAPPQSLPPADPLPLTFVARLPPGAAKESSGIIQSRRRPDLLWTHNDSGDEPRLYPLHRNGSPYRSTARPDVPGVLIENATNVDWEDIATFDDGTLIVSDMGNNKNQRLDLGLYLVDEPDPTADRSTPAQRIPVRFPDQTEFPPPKNNLNFDCEALFTVGRTLHMLTKHRSDSRTKLYRLDDPRPEQMNTLTYLADFDAGGMVVAADCDPAGKRLLMLTYQKVWLFERDDLETPFFQGRISARSFFLPQCEAICFSGDDTALLTDEIADSLFEFKLSELRPVTPGPPASTPQK